MTALLLNIQGREPQLIDTREITCLDLDRIYETTLGLVLIGKEEAPGSKPIILISEEL